MEQCGHSRSNIGHVSFAVGTAVFNPPAHHYEGNMRIIRSPSAVGCTSCPRRSTVPLGLEDDLDATASFGIVSVRNPLADAFGNTGRACLFHIRYKRYALQCP